MILFVGLLNSFASFAEQHCWLFCHCMIIVKLLHQPLTVIPLENNAHFSKINVAVSENFMIVCCFALVDITKLIKLCVCCCRDKKGTKQFNYSVQFGYHYFPRFFPELTVLWCILLHLLYAASKIRFGVARLDRVLLIPNDLPNGLRIYL